MSVYRPNTEQRDRERLEDRRPTDNDDQIGTGEHAQHTEERQAT